MAFNYFSEFISSFKTLWKNQVIFWEAVLYMFIALMIYMIPMFIMAFSTNGAQMDPFDSPGLLILYIVMIVLMYYVMAGVYRSLFKLIKGTKLTFGSLLSNAKEIFGQLLIYVLFTLVLMAPGLIVYFYGLSSIIGLENPSFTQIAAVLGYFIFFIIYALIVGYFLFFGMAAIASGKSAMNSVKESFVLATKTSHTLKTYGTIMLSTIVIMIVYMPLMMLAAALAAFIIGIPLLIALELGMAFYGFSTGLFTIKAYLQAPKTSK